MVQLKGIDSARADFLPIDTKNQKKSLVRGRLVVDLIRDEAPSWKGAAMPVSGMAVRGLQIARHLANALPTLGPASPIASQLSGATSSVWFFLGVNEVKNGLSDYKKAALITDEEGKGNARGRVLSGTILTEGALVGLAGKAVEWGGVSSAAGAGLSFASTQIFGVGSLIGFCIAGLGLYRSLKFRASLMEPSEKVIEFLKNSITVTDEEATKIIAEAETLTLSPSEKSAWVERKLFEKTEVKMLALRRRTSQKTLNMILEHLSNPTLEGREKLIETVKKENQKTAILYAVALVAAAIGVAALIAGTFFTAGILPFVLYGVSAGIYLTLAAHRLYNQISYTKN